MFLFELSPKPGVQSLTYYHLVIESAHPNVGFKGLLLDHDLVSAVFDSDPGDVVLSAILELWNVSQEPEMVEIAPWE